MKLTIFNVCVPMQGQEQCDKMKQVCVDNRLPIWGDEVSFVFFNVGEVFGFSGGEFFIFDLFPDDTYTQVTEPEFLTLLNEYKSKEDE